MNAPQSFCLWSEDHDGRESITSNLITCHSWASQSECGSAWMCHESSNCSISKCGDSGARIQCRVIYLWLEIIYNTQSRIITSSSPQANQRYSKHTHFSNSHRRLRCVSFHTEESVRDLKRTQNEHYCLACQTLSVMASLAESEIGLLTLSSCTTFWNSTERKTLIIGVEWNFKCKFS